MYTGKIVEESGVDEIFRKPKHPYTRGLLNSVPKLSVSQWKKTSGWKQLKASSPAQPSFRPAVISNRDAHIA
jgi:oligopeptide/dipeptide ABC transporter ATP-binding protein